MTVGELPPVAAGALGVGPRESLLVRPHGLPAGRCADVAAGLAA